MARQAAVRPTDAELEILRVLWQSGPCTVRDVHEALRRSKPTGYTTVLKLMQIMTDKGLVRRDEGQRAHVYEAAYAQEQTQQQLIGDLIERVFEGSAAKLVMRALQTKEKASSEELSEIRQVLERFERGER
ncbi:MAG TPA: BlaI/MecI/CopY family transcriptional regulator [Blastocatellia bacterium]|nr:BlaI/MecI/CopY family transcriptional regulator [Blastocatellia bacterium]